MKGPVPRKEMRASEATEKRDCLVPPLRGGGREGSPNLSLTLAGRRWLISFATTVE